MCRRERCPVDAGSVPCVDHPPEVRISDGERATAVERLFTAHREGRICLDEVDRRLAIVYAAVLTGDLAPALSDLPRPVPVTDVLELDATLGPVTRTGRWVVPRRLRVQQHFGAGGLVLLDLSGAVITHPRLDVELRLGMYGSARIVVPPGGTADLSRVRAPGRAARTDVPVEPGPGLHVVVSGVAPRRRSVRVAFGRRRG